MFESEEGHGFGYLEIDFNKLNIIRLIGKGVQGNIYEAVYDGYTACAKFFYDYD